MQRVQLPQQPRGGHGRADEHDQLRAQRDERAQEALLPERASVLADIEASNFDDTQRPSPAQIRSEVWMAFVHGAAGIQYFCHRFQPTFSETDCLDDAATATAMTNINRQLTEWRRARLLSRISGYYCLENPSAFEPLARGDGAG